MNWTDILAPLLPPLVAYLVVLLRKAILANTGPKQFAALAGLARTAVHGVEQFADAGGLSGSQKFTLASEALTASAKRMGLTLKSEEVNAFLHQAVADLKLDQKFSIQP